MIHLEYIMNNTRSHKNAELADTLVFEFFSNMKQGYIKTLNNKLILFYNAVLKIFLTMQNSYFDIIILLYNLCISRICIFNIYINL